jgi:hypothetical protein
VINVGGVALVVNRAYQAWNQSDLEVGVSQQNGAKVGGHRPTVKLCPHRESGGGWKTKLGWDRIVHRRSRLWLLTKRYWCNTNYIKWLNEIRLLL